MRDGIHVLFVLSQESKLIWQILLTGGGNADIQRKAQRQQVIAGLYSSYGSESYICGDDK